MYRFMKFVNFWCLSQSEVSTDNRKVSTFFAFQHVRCRGCYRCYLDRFLNEEQSARFTAQHCIRPSKP